ncbi:MAG: Uroporphyrinogen deCOase protein [Thermoproteota archaeon]|nr:Uroporphyrinogen deCOase protein [Thermoproteota archaeon]
MNVSKSPEELYEEREKRVRDAIELKEPDRVPVVLAMNYFPARYIGGLTVSDAFYNHEVWREATKKTIVELEPDLIAPGAGGSGSALSLLQPNLYKWAGDGLDVNSIHQYIEGEPLKAEEYDLFLSDPGDFTLRYYLPRVWRALAPFSKLPPLHSLWGASTLPSQTAPFGDSEVMKAFETLFKAGQEQETVLKIIRGFYEEMADLGYPPLSHGNASHPFDVISDHLRGMTGTMLDMYRNPCELTRACEMIITRSMESGLAALKSKRGNPKRVGTALHRGSDGFMSLKQFETYYWPYLKRLAVSFADKGLVYIPFYEGHWEQRLKYLLELPKKKTIARFAITDLNKAKDVLGDHTCIMGGVPHTLLQTASPQEVEDYCKNLIRVYGEGGGFLLSTSTGLTHEAKPENVKAMIDSVKKYGKY